MSKPRIVHIATDEKFIDGAYHLFENAFPGLNRFVIVKPAADPPIRFLNTELVINAQFEVKSPGIIKRLLKISNDHEITILHGLNKINTIIFSESSHKERFMAIVHGAEIYNSGILNNTLFGPKTKVLAEQTEQTTFYGFVKKLYRKIRYSNIGDDYEVDFRGVLYEIKYFGSLPGYSYEHHINEDLYNSSIQRIPFTYYPIEVIIKNEELRADGQNILLGNSSSATNNHLEALELLQNLDLGDRKVVAPLSYGSPKYAKEIIKEGKQLLPDHFSPLTNFLPIEEYNKVISGCGIVIMNHYRPQAMGNIIASLYLGAKVFLNDTDIYRYFKQLGCNIYLIEKDLTSSEETLVLLTQKQVRENRKILKNTLSMDVLVEELRHSFDQLFGIRKSSREVIS
ncbi:hypothetical protein CK503_10095 [Aliifodinibius salipaludis]|uniref:4-alpha-L-fucosyltransferase n=1 Tax=Fodinibius salipaludis TaxID=2032627 RepID=A0A2A2GAY8_9BACT|nr:TDP-N-acetylfucosamine:lipid II N-acetylfucosaminyltransferase [Aliifodinibius salipaludis]PAU94005.1 hypothetical protein CK503_10095 [Aliifodinibius salipaludis]